jgi:hypothetical protein
MKVAAIIALLSLGEGEDYLPLRDGGRWTYTVEEQSADAAQSSHDVVTEVGGTKSIGNVEWVEVRDFLGYATAYLQSNSEGIALRLETTDTSPVLTILKLPLREGDHWTGTLGREEVTFTTGPEERVELGARVVKAVRVGFIVSEATKHQGHSPTHGDLWYEGGTGIVKAQSTKDLDCHSGTTTVYRLKN